jgi:hypothetical protein
LILWQGHAVDGWLLLSSSLTADCRELHRQRENLIAHIQEAPSASDIEAEIVRVKDLLPTELLQAKKWKNRRDRLLQLMADLRPVNQEELTGFFDAELFPLATVPLEHQAETTIPPPTFSRPMTQEMKEALLSTTLSPDRPSSSRAKPRQSLTADFEAAADNRKGLQTPRSVQSQLLTPRSERSFTDEEFMDEFMPKRKKDPLDSMPKLSQQDSVDVGTARPPPTPELINGIFPVTFKVSQMAQKDQVKLTDIHAARKADRHLDKIFDILKGRESSLLTTMTKDGLPMQNIMAWITYEVRL